MLDEIFDDQVKFTKEVTKYFDKHKIDLIKEYLLSLSSEVSEALDCVKWKWHQQGYGEVDYEHLMEELIDIQKFLWGLMHICSMDKAELYNKYWLKTNLVQKRWNKFIEDGNKNV